MSAKDIVESQRRFFRSGGTRPVAYRKQQLAKLRDTIREMEPEIFAALREDLNKSEQEAYASEIGIVLQEIRVALRGVRKWAKPNRIRTPLSHFGASSSVYPEPYGTSLILAPWNYPFQLSLVPVVAAIAAGNTVVLKPSELAPATSALLAKLAKRAFSPEQLAVVEGGPEASEALLAEPIDHLFFTGSPAVGRIVMAAAAKRLIPVVLELGGKSPCIVHKDANVKLAAKRIAFGKLLNAGQTCVAPDYILAHRDIKQALVRSLAKEIEASFGPDPLANSDYAKIVNERHFRRLTAYLKDGTIAYGGRTDESARRIAPTLLTDVPPDSPVMTEEIFGPILPILEYADESEIEAVVNRNPKPLALYVFSENPDFRQRVVRNLPFGGGCVNDTIMHFASPYLPVGGVGTSGIGSYHGEHGFRAFSHHKSVLNQTTRFDIPFRYPQSKLGLSVIRKLLR